LDLKVDKITGKGLSTEDYTTSEKNKLASIDATHYLPPLQTTVQLSALPQAGLSDKARVYVEADLSDYFYDATASSGDIAPDDQAGGIGFWRKVAVGGETAASIKTKYESNADTNAFTDTEQALVATVSGKEETSNKSQDIETDKTSTTKYSSVKQLYDWAVAKFQAALVSGTNIKTLNGTSILGSGDIAISGGSGSVVVVKNVWVSSTGNDAAGLIGRQDLPFLTINAALDALGVNGGVVNLGLGSFNSPLYSKIESNTIFKGSGKPKYNNTVTGGASYPLYIKTTATALTGGTILLGEFRIPFDSENIQIYDLGVDAGLDWCTTFNAGVATEGLMIANGDYVNTPQNGKLLRKNVIVKNVATIVKGSADMVHSFLIENCYEPYVDNVDTYNGFAGFVYKNIGGSATSIKSHNSGTFGIVIKTNTYAYNNSTFLNDFEIDGGAGLAIQDEGDASGIQNVYISNGRIRNTSYGVKQIGTLLKYINVSNIFSSNITGLGFDFSNVQNSNFLNNSAISCGSGGFKIIGVNNRVSENRAVSNTGVGIDIRTSSGTYPSISTGNDSNNNSTYGFFYSGDIRGGHNVAISNTTAAISGTITILEAYTLPNPLSLVGAPGSYTAPLSVENTGTASAADKNVAVFSGNLGSSTNSDNNTTIGIRQKNSTVKNYSIFSFWNSSFNTIAQIAARNHSHGVSEGSISLITTLAGILNVTLVASSNGNVLIGKDQFTGVTNNDTGERLQVEGTVSAIKYKLSALNTAPSSSTDTGVLGEIRITATYIYVCTATNTWVRTALATW